MKFYPRNKEKVEKAALENWKIIPIGGNNLLSHSSCRRRQLVGVAYKGKNRESWRCEYCKVVAPKEIAFAAELAFCVQGSRGGRNR